jgi:ATP-dependent RNA helicase DDX31/DBP7
VDPSISKFDDLEICDKLKQILKENNFENLTNIQRNSIPVILKERNVVLKSETGSGKTLAYLVPLIEHLSQYALHTEKIHRETQGTMAIIFSPTRELAVQIDMEVRRLLKLFYYMVTSTIMGGENVEKEKARLRKGCIILICTPGRLLYHLENSTAFKMDKLQYLIFDEADRMLDLGFEKEMNQCLDLIKKKTPHNFLPDTEELPTDKEDRLKAQQFHSAHLKINFVSATMNPKVETLGKRLM